jgi:4-hydroxy-tetrahydrodipicolinate reductase
MKKTDIVVCGAEGKMGSLIIQLAQQDSEEFTVKAGIESKGHPLVGSKSPSGVDITDEAERVITGEEVVIDFSVPDAAMEHLDICTGKKSPFVTGITGFNKEQSALLKKASAEIPVFFAPNMSFGVNLFFEIVRYAAGVLKEYEIEISEIHHRFKKDAPSGTAKRIADIICSVSDRKPEGVIKYGRKGISGVRPADEIGMHSLRMGDVVGEHYVYFGGKGEIIELAHRCYNRESFALGALKAASFIRNKPAGMYSMENLIKTVIGS